MPILVFIIAKMRRVIRRVKPLHEAVRCQLPEFAIIVTYKATHIDLLRRRLRVALNAPANLLGNLRERSHVGMRDIHIHEAAASAPVSISGRD